MIEQQGECSHCGLVTTVAHTGYRWLCRGCWAYLLGGPER